MYSYQFDDLAPHKQIDAFFWKLCIVYKQWVHGIMRETYKVIDSNLRIVDIPEFVFDYQTRNLAIFMDIDAARWSDSIMPGVGATG